MGARADDEHLLARLGPAAPDGMRPDREKLHHRGLIEREAGGGPHEALWHAHIVAIPPSRCTPSTSSVRQQLALPCRHALQWPQDR